METVLVLQLPVNINLFSTINFIKNEWHVSFNTFSNLICLVAGEKLLPFPH